MNKGQAGFGVIEILLIMIVIGVLGGTGWYALHTKHQTDQILAQSEKTSQSILSKTSIVNSFEECTKAAGSKTEATFPEICVSKSGKSFTNPNQSAPQVPAR